MSSSLPPDEPLGRAEQRLLALLAVLRVDPADDDAAAVRRLMLSLRWQRAVRSALATVGAFAGTLGDGLSLLLRRRRPEE
jgi:hypothetical protein